MFSWRTALEYEHRTYLEPVGGFAEVAAESRGDLARIEAYVVGPVHASVLFLTFGARPVFGVADIEEIGLLAQFVERLL